MSADHLVASLSHSDRQTALANIHDALRRSLQSSALFQLQGEMLLAGGHLDNAIASFDDALMSLPSPVRRATRELMAPIERIEVVGDRVDCYSGSRQISLAFSYSPIGHYENENSDRPTPGTFHMSVGGASLHVWVVTKPEERKNLIAKTLARVFRRRGA